MKTFIHKLKQFPRLILSITLLSLLAACGGSSTPAPTPPSGDATLKSLRLSAGDISPAFTSGKLEYTLKTTQSRTTVTPTAYNYKAAIRVNGVKVKSQETSAEITFDDEDSKVIEIAVASEDGMSTKTYTVTVIVLSTDASLSGLSVSAGDMDSIFSSDVLEYKLKANQDQNSITVTPTNNSNATISVNGVAVKSGDASAAIALSKDSKEIKIVVTAEDEVTTKTYTITVLSRDASLLGLSFSAGNISPIFSSDVLAYTLNTDQGGITVTPKVNNSNNATIRVNGVAVKSGDASTAITFTSFESPIEIKIVVTAEDETTTGTYIINASRNIPKPVLSMVPTPTKDFVFTFSVAGDSASKAGLQYKLSENKDGEHGFVEIATFSTDTEPYRHNVSLIQRLNAEYILSACTAAGVCVDSNELTVDVADLAKAIGYFKASNTRKHDEFGYGMALSADGNTLAVGAYKEESSTAVDAGAVYVFSRSTAGVWSQQAHVKASNTGQKEQFGWSVALSEDGNTLAVGARYEHSQSTGINNPKLEGTNAIGSSGAVYVFIRQASAWSQQAYVKASNTGVGDVFGWSVALSADGNTLAVGARWEDSNGKGINPITEGNNDAGDSGAVYVFIRQGSTWSQQAYVKASNTGADDYFGYSVALSADGNTLAVGAHWEDSNSKVIGNNPTTEGNNSASNSGAVYVFSRAAGAWSQQAYVKASNTGASDYFGISVALSTDGNTLAVGASGEDSNSKVIGNNPETEGNNSASNSGAVYVFSRAAGAWSQQAYVKASNTGASDSFGMSVALSADGNILAVGAYKESSNSKVTGINPNTQNDNSAGGSGAVYMFSRTDSAWSQQAYVKASNTGAGDWFGVSVALSADGKTLAVGATGEASNGRGINPDAQSNNSAEYSGAVYLY